MTPVILTMIQYPSIIAIVSQLIMASYNYHFYQYPPIHVTSHTKTFTHNVQEISALVTISVTTPPYHLVNVNVQDRMMNLHLGVVYPLFL